MITAILPKDWNQWHQRETAISHIFNTLPLVFEEYKKQKTESIGVYFEGNPILQAEIGCYNINRPYIEEKQYSKVFFKTGTCMNEKGYNGLKIYEDIEARNVSAYQYGGFLKEYAKNSKNGMFKLPLCRKPMTAEDWLKKPRVITTEKRLKSWWDRQVKSNKPSLGCPSDELSINGVRIRFVIRNESSRSTSYSGLGMQVFDEQKNRWRFVHSATKPITHDMSYKSCKIYYDRIKFIVSKANERGLDTSYTTLCAIAKEFYYNGNKRTSEKKISGVESLLQFSKESTKGFNFKINCELHGETISCAYVRPKQNNSIWISFKIPNSEDSAQKLNINYYSHCGEWYTSLCKDYFKINELDRAVNYVKDVFRQCVKMKFNPQDKEGIINSAKTVMYNYK